MNTLPPRIVLASNNAGKLAEVTAILGVHGVDVVPVGQLIAGWTVEETGETFEANALLKAHDLAGRVGSPALADDSGLEVEALDGAPGIRSARYAGVHGDDAANKAGHDAVAAAARGKTAVAVVTQEFESLSHTMAANAGRAGLRVQVLPEERIPTTAAELRILADGVLPEARPEFSLRENANDDHRPRRNSARRPQTPQRRGHCPVTGIDQDLP